VRTAAGRQRGISAAVSELRWSAGAQAHKGRTQFRVALAASARHAGKRGKILRAATRHAAGLLDRLNEWNGAAALTHAPPGPITRY